MKNNSYTKHLKNITAPQNLVDDTISKIYGADVKSIETSQKNEKYSGYRLIGAVAAVLVLVIGLSFIPFVGDKPDDDHSFIITAGAAQINPDSYVVLGEVTNYGTHASFKPKGEIDLNNFDGCGEFDVIRIDKLFLIRELNVYGGNIESVTYTTKNCSLAYDSKFDGVVDVKPLVDEEATGDEKAITHSFNNYKYAKSCTFDFYSQKKSIASREWEGTPKLGVEFSLDFEEGEHTVYIEEENNYDENILFEQEFNACADEYSLDVTANYRDGRSLTKTLKFRCEYVEGELPVLYAIEV